MAEENQDQGTPVVVPDNLETVPDELKTVYEKFKGKPIEDVLKSYAGAEKKITETGQEKSALQKRLEEIEAAQTPEPEPEPEPAETDWEYMTRADLKKELKRLQESNKPQEIDTAKIIQEAVNTALGVVEAKSYAKEQGLDQETLQQVVQIGGQLGANTVDEAVSKFADFAKKLGIAQSGEGGQTITLPRNLEGGGEGTEPDGSERMARLRAAAKSTKLSSKIKFS